VARRSSLLFLAVHLPSELYPGSEDAELGVLSNSRCVKEKRQFTRKFKLKTVRLIKQCGISYARRRKTLDFIRRNCAIEQLADDP
jgi:hypothetical protein